VEAEGPTLDSLWEAGGWLRAAGALRTAIAELTPEEFHQKLDAALSDHRAGTGPILTPIRRRRIQALIEQILAEPDQRQAEVEAWRADNDANRVMHTAASLPLLRAALTDEGLSPNALVLAQLERVRTITPDDAEHIFDLERMADCSKELCVFLIERSRENDRYDDFQLGTRFGHLHTECAREDVKSIIGMAVFCLDAMLERPIASEAEAIERMRQIRSIVDFFTQANALSILPEDIAAAARDASPESFGRALHTEEYRATFERLFNAYSGTANPVYLEDLLRLLYVPHDGPGDREAAWRMNDLALVLNAYGRAHFLPTALAAAVQTQDAAISMIDSSDPSWSMYRANAAAYRIGWLSFTGASFQGEIEKIRELLPPLPFDSKLENVEGIADAYATRAAAELAFALHESTPNPGETLAGALEATEVARRLLTPEAGWHDLNDLAVWATCIRLLDRAHDGGAPEDDDLSLLTQALAAPRLFDGAIDIVISTAAKLIDSHPSTRPHLRSSLQTAIQATRPYAGDQLNRTFRLYGLLTRLALVEDDVMRGDAERDRVLGYLRMLLNAGGHVALREPRRELGNRGVRLAATSQREAALQFAKAGLPEIAAILCETSAGLLAGHATVVSTAAAERQDLIEAQFEAGARSASLLLLSAEDEIAVLTREPGDEWKVASRHPRSALAPFEAFDWLAKEGPGSVSALRAWLDEIAPALTAILAEPLARLRECTKDPVLCLPTGMFGALPLSLSSPIEDGTRAPLVIVPGPLADGVTELVTEPFPAEPKIGVILGAAQLPGAGAGAGDGDIEAIRSTGIAPDVIDSLAEGDAVDRLRSAAAIHFCGHLIPNGPDDTAFVFADQTTLPLSVVRNIRLGPTKVVTLISCYSAFWPSRAAEQIEHAAGAFLEAGAGTVVACLWPAFDRPAQLFTRAFYEGINTESSIADAFAAGISAIREDGGEQKPFEHPIYWAGFTLFAGPGSWWRHRSGQGEAR
jgi:hypothetical protein